MLIDTHAHLQDEKYEGDALKLIENAKLNNVQKIICASFNLQSSIDACEYSNQFDNVFATVGIHPEDCETYSKEVEQELEKLCNNKKVVAIGEIGLDYHYEGFDKEKQKFAFVKQIELATKLKLPIVIHTRDAIGDTMEILRKYKDKLKFGVVLHCFNASKEILKEVMEMGFYVSYGGAITFNNATSLREIVGLTNVDRILTETDCPYMTPVPHRGEVNEPKNIKFIIEKISEIKNIELNELEKIIENNVKNIFKI